MQKSTKWTGLGVAGALTAAALVVPGISTAQTDDATDDAANSERQERREARQQEFLDALADELGISVEELEEAFENVRAEMREQRLAELRERLDQKVADGELTQEEADEIWERAEDGDRHWFRHRRWHRHHDRAFGPHDGDAGEGTPGEASVDSTAT